MKFYILRRILYALPILFGVNLLTFVFFFVVNSSDDIARMHLGERFVTQHQIDTWKQVRGYDLPLLYNTTEHGIKQWTHTIFFQKSIKLFVFDFGRSDSGQDISHDIQTRMFPSLAIALPTLLLGLLVNITFALTIILFRGTYLDPSASILCITIMSISALFYIIGGQYLFAKLWHLFPISGYQDGLASMRFVALPILIGVVSGIGTGTRWYRTIFLEEANKEYVRTAYAKGLSHRAVLVHHILPNGMIPILTGVVVVIPLLFLGSLIMESFFGIPGLGSYMIEAIARQDFAIIRSIVFLGSVLYVLGLLLTDISYTLVDPRIHLK